jgi:hypothetical protein
MYDVEPLGYHAATSQGWVSGSGDAAGWSAPGEQAPRASNAMARPVVIERCDLGSVGLMTFKTLPMAPQGYLTQSRCSGDVDSLAAHDDRRG